MESTTPSGIPLIMIDQIVLDSTMDSRSSSSKDVTFSSCSFSSGSVDMTKDLKPLSEKNTLSYEHSIEFPIPSTMHSQNEKTANIFKKNHISPHKSSSSVYQSKSDPSIKGSPLVEIQPVPTSISNPELSFSKHLIEDVKNETKKNIDEAYMQPEKKRRKSLKRTLSKSKCSSKILSSLGSEEEKIKESIGLSPLQKHVTCDELIIKGFNNIDESLVSNMLPLERVNLSLALENTIKKIDELRNKDRVSFVSLQSFKHPQQEEVYTRNCSSLSLVKSVQKKLRDDQLIGLIQENSNNLWDGLSLSGETIIPSDQLFTLIFAYIQQQGQDEVDHDKILTLLMFCSHWLNVNQGNKLVKNTKNQIEEIVLMTSYHPKDVIQIESKKLSGSLKIALGDRIITCNQINFVSNESFDFNLILEDICRKKIKSSMYKTMVEMTAKDLCYSQVAYYLQITAQDFFEENWDTPSMLHLMRNHCNLLNAYVNQMIFSNKNFEESVLLLKFFLNVGYKCLQGNDFSSACAIGGIFYNSLFKENSNVWDEVISSDKQYHSIFKKFNEIFYGKSSKIQRSALETCYNDDKFFIPHMGIYLRDIEIGKSHPPIYESGNQDPEYNLIKIKIIQESIQKSLQGQIKWKNSEYEKYIYKTNLLSHILPMFQSSNGQ